MADRKISDLTALTTPAAGDYLPIIDISEPLAANKNKRITIEELLRGAPDGTAGAPGFAFESDPDSGLYSTGANGVALSTGGTGRLFVDASGKVGIGEPITQANLHVAANISDATAITWSNSQLSVATPIPGNSTANRATIYFAPYGSDNNYAPAAITSTAGTNGASTLKFFTNPSGNLTGDISSYERLRITSAGLVGVGTSSPQATLHANGAILSSGALAALSASNIFFDQPTSALSRIGVVGANTSTAGTFRISQYSSDGSVGRDAFSIDSSGRVGIGTTSPGKTGSNRTVVTINAPTGQLSILEFGVNNALTGYLYSNASQTTLNSQNTPITFDIQGERARIDSSGRLLVGTSTARSNFDIATTTIAPQFQIEGTTAAAASISVVRNSATSDAYARICLAKTRGASAGLNTSVASGDDLGELLFNGADGTNLIEAASIKAQVDGTPGANDMPGRLVFSTTADGASSPTERMRIASTGDVWIANTTGSASNTGFIVTADGATYSTRSGDRPAYINRLVNDGDLVAFVQDNTIEGTISVSGTTVSYNGAHLSRWSQLASGAERIEILRGTVLSNIDEMCEWGDEDNEQLNRMKVSDVEGDKNVSGVFQCWDDDDDTYTNDFYCAMTGDFIIRIAAGTTVQRGDLLMSAGDGTAKPQDDDIIRSKTIAKVTSTNVSCTYDDGSYCVPCVLMAC